MAKVPNYKEAVAYWSSQPTTVDGMLGGYGTGRVPRLDIAHSRLFLRQLVSANQLNGLPDAAAADEPTMDDGADPPSKRARVEAATDVEEARQAEAAVRETKKVLRTVDCGAGIGRVTRDLLLSVSDVVDIVEPCAPFTESLASSPDFKGARESGQLGDILTIGVQDFEPRKESYNIIWNQWCLGQLPDEDLILYLTRCRPALIPNGLIFVKENVAAGEDVFDEQDSSWTRSEASWNRIFRESGCKVVKSSVQHGFPKELFKVKLWAMR